jgi:glutaconate CoA-transferase subunit B
MTAKREQENLVLAMATELRNGEVCFVGIGVPSLAAMLAKRTHAPDLVLVYESGSIDANPSVPPISTGSSSVLDDTAMVGDCLDVFGDLQAGRVHVGLLSAAQVDRRGNLNSTVIGPYREPKLRMVGSGGAHDIACLAHRVVIGIPHEPRRFVEQVDFVTSPGCLNVGSSRMELRLGGGPAALVTGRARFSFASGELRLSAVFEPFTPEEAVSGLPWAVPVCPDLQPMQRFDEKAVACAQELL